MAARDKPARNKAANLLKYTNIDDEDRLRIKLANWEGFVASQLPLSRLFVFITGDTRGLVVSIGIFLSFKKVLEIPFPLSLILTCNVC